MWYRELVPVSNGFDTLFTFQITDHSKECTLHKDQYFSIIHHRTCSIHGGDGFAFVIQNDLLGLQALGGVGGDMGFGGTSTGTGGSIGIKNSLAIAFDMFSNPILDVISGSDHISIQSKSSAANSAYDDGMLGYPIAYDLADGLVHFVRIVYWNELLPQYYTNVMASETLLPYIKDNGEGKRVGTLMVYIDNGIVNDQPIIVMPINLSVLLDLPDDVAYVGFTASTGKFYEKHDILSWYWCDNEPCKLVDYATFDYHHANNITANNLRLRQFTPGGIGGGYYGGSNGLEGFPTKMQNPNTDPWTEPIEHFSLSRTHDLSSDSIIQQSPQTLY